MLERDGVDVVDAVDNADNLLFEVRLGCLS